MTVNQAKVRQQSDPFAKSLFMFNFRLGLLTAPCLALEALRIKGQGKQASPSEGERGVRAVAAVSEATVAAATSRSK